MTIEDKDLDELQKLCDSATPGPWESLGGSVWHPKSNHSSVCDVDAGAGDDTLPDARFIAASRDALPKLIAEVRQLLADARCLADFVRQLNFSGDLIDEAVEVGMNHFRERTAKWCDKAILEAAVDRYPEDAK